MQFNAYTGGMQFTPYGGVAAQLAAALVNAAPGATTATYEDLIETYDYRGTSPVTPAEAAELTAWAERLRPVFSEPALQPRVDLVNELLAVVAARPYLSQHHDRPPHFHYAAEDAPTVQRIKAYTIMGVGHVLCDDPQRIGSCGRPGCATVFVDTSRNGRRRFCSPECANRAHVAAHRRRQRAGTA
ncbi:CGNR zinc finger domain-containing protein [Amycolatopsis dongchuanensis]|uniref:CGNR zinc finger domain-containing protein n=2 Tax=Pseudonocardiaceae TaxID=2070 RepID=A0ABP9QUI9_9PSEU